MLAAGVARRLPAGARLRGSCAVGAVAVDRVRKELGGCGQRHAPQGDLDGLEVAGGALAQELFDFLLDLRRERTIAGRLTFELPSLTHSK